MNTKTIISTLVIAVITVFTLVSFTTKDTAKDLTSFDQSFYADANTTEAIFNFSTDIVENAKCGGDKKAKGTKDAKDAKKCGTGKCGDDAKKAKKEAKESKCGAGKCGDDANLPADKAGKAKDAKETKKADEGKEAKCGTGKCG